MWQENVVLSTEVLRQKFTVHIEDVVLSTEVLRQKFTVHIEDVVLSTEVLRQKFTVHIEDVVLSTEVLRQKFTVHMCIYSGTCTCTCTCTCSMHRRFVTYAPRLGLSTWQTPTVCSYTASTCWLATSGKGPSFLLPCLLTERPLECYQSLLTKLDSKCLDSFTYIKVKLET